MLSLGARVKGLRSERIHSSTQFRNGSFRNTLPVGPGLKRGTVTDVVWSYVAGGQQRVPKRALPLIDPRPGWQRPPETGLRATWLGHSTVLLELDGCRVLTDPVWGNRVSPVRFAGPKRFHPAPADIAALPDLDAVLVSHDHYDHLDYPSIVELAKRDVPFITSLGVGAHLQHWGVPPERIFELDWWESHALRGGELQVTAAPSQHFSGRGAGLPNATLWSSFAIRTARHAVFFSGDTGLTEEYREIAARLGPFDLVMLEIGAFHPAWGDIHLGPENALRALDMLGGGRLLPVHWSTFNLALHAWDEPGDTLLELAPKLGGDLVTPMLGEPLEPTRVEGANPWWRGSQAGNP